MSLDERFERSDFHSEPIIRIVSVTTFLHSVRLVSADESCTTDAHAHAESMEYMCIPAVRVSEKLYLVYVLIELIRKYTSSNAEGVLAT